MRKILTVFVFIITLIVLTACKTTSTEKSENTNNTSSSGTTTAIDNTPGSLKFNLAFDNYERTMTYNQGDPLVMPDGKTFVQGDLKPVWQYISEELNIDFEDVTIQDQSGAEMINFSATTQFTDADIYGGNSIGDELMAYGAQGYFVNLNEHLNSMPNFKAYLDEYPSVKKAITAYDGGIYHIPYVAEIDNFARMYEVRESWVKTLLDSPLSGLETETAQITTAFQPYWIGSNARNIQNVIQLQNTAATGGLLTRNVALTKLVDYIKVTYPTFASQPSKLFLGAEAKYDIDELVALWRVIRLSPNTLSKLETGTANPEAVIAPYFVRQSSYREELFRLANYFNGQRVHGSDSYGSRFYLDNEGELQFSYAEDSFLQILDSFKAMYSEGLIHQEFADKSNKTNFRMDFYGKDTVVSHKLFGFMTFDFTASTTGIKDQTDVTAILPPVSKINGGNEFVHYIENTRVIKPDGWSISKTTTGKDLDDALRLFDYMFSEEGNVVQNYGVPANIDQNEQFTAPDGTKHPKLNAWFLEQATEHSSGDASTFVRDYIGGNMPIGYSKEIGFEYQYTSAQGFASWKLYNEANIFSSTYKATTSPYFSLVPPVFSLTEVDSDILATLNIGDSQVDAMFAYVTGAQNAAADWEAIKQLYVAAGIEDYIDIYRVAYESMK
ncbi:MAG: hypothetical protein K0Q49_173 [Haloplasmataceae bacterium]|nr:hypothetical protein [Haloplasmataceae bacterium]